MTPLAHIRTMRAIWGWSWSRCIGRALVLRCTTRDWSTAEGRRVWRLPVWRA